MKKLSVLLVVVMLATLFAACAAPAAAPAPAAPTAAPAPTTAPEPTAAPEAAPAPAQGEVVPQPAADQVTAETFGLKPGKPYDAMLAGNSAAGTRATSRFSSSPRCWRRRPASR